VTPQELATIRKRLGLTPDSLAAELNLTPGIVEAWESGRIGASRRAEQWLTWRGAMLDRDEAVSASGLPECATLRAVATDVTGGEGTKAARQRADTVLAHLAVCPTCLARKRFLDERFPPMPPPPLPAALALIVWIHGRINAIRLRIRSWREARKRRVVSSE
jgi:transcriptional regulator with XRE-family HTH domain